MKTRTVLNIHRYPWLIIFVSLFVFSNAQAENNTPAKKGNFSLATSQQPGPLLSIGGNIIDAKVAQLYLFLTDIEGHQQEYINTVPSFLYGLSDRLSIYFNAPFALYYRQSLTHSSGWEDVYLQFEYAYYAKETKSFTNQATFFANIALPSGSTQKQPNTGTGAPSFLLGGTFSRMGYQWFGFVSYGATLTCSSDETHYGNSFLYQGGVGRTLLSKADRYIFAALVEVDGEYAQHDRLHGIRNDNSGGNSITLTPSLWFSTPKIILQFGVGGWLLQNLHGNQNKNHYIIAADFGWTWN